MQLNEFELELFSRQFLIKNWGQTQQDALKTSKVLITKENEIAARYLISAGIGDIYLKNLNLFEKLKGYELNTKIQLFSNINHEYDYKIDFEDKEDLFGNSILEAAKCINTILETKHASIY